MLWSHVVHWPLAKFDELHDGLQGTGLQYARRGHEVSPKSPPLVSITRSSSNRATQLSFSAAANDKIQRRASGLLLHPSAGGLVNCNANTSSLLQSLGLSAAQLQLATAAANQLRSLCMKQKISRVHFLSPQSQTFRGCILLACRSTSSASRMVQSLRLPSN